MGTGDGSFTLGQTVAGGQQPYMAIAADFDGDGDLDIASANFGEASLTVALNDGSGTFAEPVSYDTGKAPRALVAGDLDGDGILDLAIANRFSPFVTLLYQRLD